MPVKRQVAKCTERNVKWRRQEKRKNHRDKDIERKRKRERAGSNSGVVNVRV